MNYDKIRNKGHVDTLGLSCAFLQCHVYGQRERKVVRPTLPSGFTDWAGPAKIHLETDEDFATRLWEALCEILTRAEDRPVFVPTTDQEPEWRDFVALCPYAELISETKSRHGNYRVQMWLFDLKGQK